MEKSLLFCIIRAFIRSIPVKSIWYLLPALLSRNLTARTSSGTYNSGTDCGCLAGDVVLGEQSRAEPRDTRTVPGNQGGLQWLHAWMDLQ